MKEIPNTYEHEAIEESILRRWSNAKAFAAFPDERENRYVIMMPLPNVTGALHMGHAMDNVMQDLLVRWHRMMNDNTLWMPGTDHAGIATQAVVEKRLFELEGKTRHDIGRDALVKRIWEWKDQYQQRIAQQQQRMACSCDWDRQRFTMDPVCTAAVREAFFRLFKDCLIYRGNRLVNWDCQLQTPISDDEIVYDKVAGHFWHLRYPIIDPRPGEPEYVVVATTRPETMLGDTAVACHPDPAAELDTQIQYLKEKISKAPAKDTSELKEALERIEQSKSTRLPLLQKLVEMAKADRKVRLPLQEREIPLILDGWANPELGSGCVKITPGHDPNDYDVWQRHQEEIEIINILNPNGTLNENAGVYNGLDRFDARAQVVADLEAKGLIEAIEDREIQIGHSDRSKTQIEPYLSKQWFVRMGDVEGGIALGRGTPIESHSAGLAQAAMNAIREDWQSPTGRKLNFHPDPVRYGNTYQNWLAEKRDWCISRQLWWGHRIPVWYGTFDSTKLKSVLNDLPDNDNLWVWIAGPDDQLLNIEDAMKLAEASSIADSYEVQVCLRNQDAEEKYSARLVAIGLTQDPDVLDTWFSSAIWPFSTLGWPDPTNARVEIGQSTTAGKDGKPDALSYYYPGSCLVTARDIITLWVARMVIMGLYNLGDLPFTDVFVHATILDGKGERMSKSKGNGIDPVDIIDRYGTDSLRYVLCDMQTGSQDIRLPIQAISPYTNNLVDLATAKHGRSIFTYICPESGKEFDVLGTMPDLPAAKITSDRFDVGKSFCNKLWNASRLALMYIQEQDFRSLSSDMLCPEDHWILSRLSKTISGVIVQLESYNPSAAIRQAREFMWSDFCDWYLELIKPRLKEEKTSSVVCQVLAVVLDQLLRLLHPFIPFITEWIWDALNERMRVRGLDKPLSSSELLILASWPQPNSDWEDATLEAEFNLMKEVTRGFRNIRNKYDVPPGKKLQALVKAKGKEASTLGKMSPNIQNMASLSSLQVSESATRPSLSASEVVGEIEIYLLGVLDPEKEKFRLRKQQDKLLGILARTEKKLANKQFLNNAPTKVVEAENQKLKGLKEQLALIEENLKALN